MKKFISLLICFLLISLISSMVLITCQSSDLNTISLPKGDSYPITELSRSDIYDTDIESIYIPDNILNIRSNAFDYCTNLKKISLHRQLQSIEPSAFADTEYYNNPDNWENGVLYIENCLIKADPEFVTDSYTVRENTTLIACEAFKDCEELNTIIIPDTVEYVGYDAFENTGYYNNPDNWENGVLYLGEILLHVSEDFTGELKIRDSIVSIADYALANCQSLTSVTTPDSLKHIGQSAFLFCRSLIEIHLGKNLKTLDSGCFNDCCNLSQISLSQDNDYFTLSDSILYNKSLTKVIRCPLTASGEITLPDSVREILPCAFSGCTQLRSVIFPKKLLFIDNSAFYSAGLTSLILPDNLRYVGDFAFASCLELTEIIIPDSVTTLGKYAFDSCVALKSVIVGKGLTYLPYACFKHCIKLTDVSLTGENINYISNLAFFETPLLKNTSNYKNNMLIISEHYLIKVSEDATYCLIPDEVTCIANNAFEKPLEKGVLKQITIPVYVCNLSESVFGGPLDGVTINYSGSTDMLTSISDIEYKKYDLHTETSRSLEQTFILLTYFCYLFILGLIIINNIKAKKIRKRGAKHEN